ncbi:hypothetical protein BU24DRAFT_7643 [Aaosphaeria arxii CBS 175.79]|uniref:C2H2-type domain-containing protein n=1 Tax=Aaosphaeria arxii CBS 175.79 TaxID=1450172 RepID=A0A6A5Y6T0_9PLEO|nr:uncharacterized protein BU24DRAFT_7643 [Aaosphaeria arxii CBS 175.79]KAF2020727.1 hypothetical protein BU24DRAFT_7643 [Aaosphaeria arxii CBS 175.79]
MSSQKQGAYGGAKTGGDTHRKTWDREEYAQRAKDHDHKSKEESKARYEAALAGKKYHRRASTPPDVRATEARQARLDVASRVGTTVLVGASAATGKRGKGAGFYCEACDLTFKDHLSYVEHSNSIQHLRAIGQSTEVAVATLEDVRNRLLWLKRKRDEEQRDVVVDLDTRLERNRLTEEQEQEEKRRKRREKRKNKKKADDDNVMKYESDDDGVIR